ncbi:mucin-1 isoform X1 [Camelus dromedarius]|uniref:Mucin-1 n=2 Tax=Camelus TaxID=9836 RepID=A0A8B6Y5M6_CAMFR|nr:mucin-1 isoform X1 [Camelus ferus]XP_010952252.1 mucin-1 isoform X1 [Camelus bactrianus]XP_010978168.1 mucin-1 isoform X1 [Camelus dromedarius]XP_031292010.1 mucin-1 isoform X1 [Camelus dromedarius]XP_032320002.1 mucin-1 isoform X1 [Camelus ferus]XP_045371907.1 mucin-1 isoform X1 [Camelus bactrianus]
MTRDIQAPFFFLLLFPVLTAASSTTPTAVFTTSDYTSGNIQASSSQSSPASSVTDSSAVNTTSSLAFTHSPAQGSVTTPFYNDSSSLTTNDTSSPTPSPASSSVVTPGAHESTSSKAIVTPDDIVTPSSAPSNHSDIPTTPTSHIMETITSSTNHSIVSPTSIATTSQQLTGSVFLYFLSFHIINHQFDFSLENSSTPYYQALQRNISEWFSQLFDGNFLGFSYVKFSPGSVVVELILVLREDIIDANYLNTEYPWIIAQATKYNLTISRLSVTDVSLPSSAQSGSGVPGWGIALLVLVCILVALAIIYVIAMTVCHWQRKNYGQLDVFSTGDAYHPMSEYPTYHTHGRYVPPGNAKRSPYEEVSAGNGGSNLSYTNLAATSPNL